MGDRRPNPPPDLYPELSYLEQLPKAPQHQGSLDAQLRELQVVANRLGLQDAADYLRNVLEGR